MKAAKDLAAEQQKNRGVGGYHSNIEIDGNVIGQEYFDDLNMDAAKRIIADPKFHLPFASFAN